MKTLKFFALILFALFIVNTVQAQWPPVSTDDTRTITTVLSGMIALDVWCDGEKVDVLLGPADVKAKFHFKNGNLIWEKLFGAQNKLTSQLTSEGTGEVFKVLTSEKSSYIDRGMAQEMVNVFHFKAKGDQGSMYNGHMTIKWLPDWSYEILEARVNCH